MKEILLSSGDVCFVDDEDYSFINQWRWKPIKSKSHIYAGRTVRCCGGKEWDTILMHRLLSDAPGDKQVDHIDGNSLNNQRGNIRICTQSQNMMNSPGFKLRASKYKGVSKNGSGWIARTKKDGKMHCFGTYKTEEEAARAYDVGVVDVHDRDFCFLNFPEENSCPTMMI